MEYVGNTALTISHDTGSDISLGAFVITSIPSPKVKADGLNVFFGPLFFTFTGGDGPGCEPGTVTGSGAISYSSTKVISGGTFVIREGDTGTLIGAGVSSGGSSVPVSGPVIISDAGQNKVRAK